jgi:hypothetical protein
VSEYTKVNLVTDVEDMAPGFGVEGIQARFARKHLELTKGGIGLFRIEPNVRTPGATSTPSRRRSTSS